MFHNPRDGAPDTAAQSMTQSTVPQTGQVPGAIHRESHSSRDTSMPERATRMCLPRALSSKSAIVIEPIGQGTSGDKARDMWSLSEKLHTDSRLSGIEVELVGVRVSHDHIDVHPVTNQPHFISDYDMKDTSKIAARVGYLLADRYTDAVWLAVHDSRLVPDMTTAFLTNWTATSPAAVPSKVVIGSGHATLFLNAVAHYLGLVTFLGCEPRRGDRYTGTYMSNPASLSNLIWRCGPESQERSQVLSSSAADICLPPQPPSLVTARLFGGDIVRFNEFLNLRGQPRPEQPFILALESSRVSFDEIERTIRAWDNLEFFRDVSAIILGKIDIEGEPQGQAQVMQLLRKHAADKHQVPLVCTKSFGGKTNPCFLPIGGTVTLQLARGCASLTIPVSVQG